MPIYKAPLKDMKFIFADVLGGHQLGEMDAYQDFSADDMAMIAEEAAKVVEKEFVPINATGDQQGCRYNPEDHSVKTPDGFPEAYKAYAEAGWIGLSAPTEYGGQGLPHIMNFMLDEMMSAANAAFCLYPGLSHSAINALAIHANDTLKDTYLPKLISGEWGGTMCLTEPHCGTDLGLIKTRAKPNADGSYGITGTKIWITGGEQDLTDNIIHLVLAKTPDAPDNVKGISLFLVPKFLEDGTRNGVFCGGLEHKMGINGSATCVINLENATGWLVGTEMKGMSHMFTMMNAARLMVGCQAIGIAESAYQTSVAFMRDRKQSRSLAGPQDPNSAADPIWVHPDVRRMILRQKVMTEGMRALLYWAGIHLDQSLHHNDAAVRQASADRVALLTPICKAFISDESNRAVDQAVQSMGGSGFVQDWGVEQLLRDIRISRIYEGTNGIQALDLAGRKMHMNNGAAFHSVVEEVQGFVDANPTGLGVTNLKEALGALKAGAEHLMAISQASPVAMGGAASAFLNLAGFTLVGFMWCRMAATAQLRLSEGQDAAFHQAKLKSCQYYMERILPEFHSCLSEVRAPVETLMTFEDHDLDSQF